MLSLSNLDALLPSNHELCSYMVWNIFVGTCIHQVTVQNKMPLYSYYFVFFFGCFPSSCFRDWILSQASGKSLLIWAHSIELAPIYGHQHQHRIGYRIISWLVYVSYLLLVQVSGVGTSSVDWARLSRFLPEDGDRIRSPKRCVQDHRQENKHHYHHGKSTDVHNFTTKTYD
jgi:hypothetical protein